MAEEKLINKNKFLFGPGPVRRVPQGAFRSYGAMPPLRGFSIAAAQGVALALATSYAFKIFVGDVQIKQIEDYYKENPPR